MCEVDNIKSIIDDEIQNFYDLADYLHDNPELGLVEYKSSAYIKNLLRKYDFEICENVSDIETAFIGTYGTGDITIGISCEYDALPNGHSCGHSLLGAGTVGASIILRKYIEKYNLNAKIKILGCPSEERDAAKVFMGRDGHFSDLDFALTFHPESFNAIWLGGSLANTIAVYNFKGTPSHAAGAPELGRLS